MLAFNSRLTLPVLAVGFIHQVLSETTLQGSITGYGSASNDPAGSSTICCGLQGSENAATYDNPGVVASDNSKYPVHTKIYIPGLQKYFEVLDSCADCQNQNVHFDIWVGPTGYQDYNSLLNCAEHDGADSATIILDPSPGYAVDSTPLMDSSGKCDPNVDYSRTSPSLSDGQVPDGKSKETTTSTGIVPSTLATVTSTPTSSPTVSPSSSPGSGSGDGDGGGDCDWKGHCQGAPCQTYNDCGDPFQCINNVCT